MSKRLLLLLPLLLFMSACESVFFFPTGSILYHPNICKNRPTDYFITTDDNITLHSWLFKTTAEVDKGTIIFMHGNSRNISTEVLPMLWVLDKGYNLFTFDYRGYGISQGKPSVEGVLKDGVEALDAFMQIKDLDKSNIILMGQSLGGAVASYIAAKSPHADKVNILVLDSTFTSWRNIVKDVASSNALTWLFQYPFSWPFPDNMSSEELLPESKIKKTIIMHSTEDELIGIAHGRRLFELAKEPKIFLEYSKEAHAMILSIPANRQRFLDALEAK